MTAYHGLYGAPVISGSDITKFAEPKSIPTSSTNGLYNDGSLNPSSVSSSNGLSGLGNLQQYGFDKPTTVEKMKEFEKYFPAQEPS